MANLYKLWRRSRFGKQQSRATGEKSGEHANTRDEKEGRTIKTLLEAQAEDWFKTRRWKVQLSSDGLLMTACSFI